LRSAKSAKSAETVNWEGDPSLRAAARSLRAPGEECPSEEEILAFVGGTPAEGAPEAEEAEGAETMREHLARCRRCSAAARDAVAFAALWRPAATGARRPLPTLLGWAAVLAFAVGAVFWLRAPGEAPSHRAAELPLQAAPYSLGSAGERWRGAEAADSLASLASLDAAMEPYGRGDYRAAVGALDEHLRRWPADGAARFYRGVALLLEGRAGEAIRSLEEAAELEHQLPRGEVEWYLALAFLRDGQRDRAVAALGTVEALSAERRDAALRLRRRVLAQR
jgi:tetratricopeptide (TPR) repeat protein